MRLARTTRPWLLAPLALAILALAPSVASATVTTSQITSPGDPYYRLDDSNASAADRQITVSGTTDGTTSDAVDLRCYYGYWAGGSQDYYTLATSVLVDADGSFSYTGDISPLSGNQQACRLIAVPSGSSPGLADFHGPRVAVTYLERWTTQLQDGSQAATDYYVDSPGFKGAPQYESAGDEGLYNYYGVTNRQNFGRANYASWSDGAGLFDYSYRSGESGIQVDGKNAYNNANAPSFDPGPPATYGKPPGYEPLASDVQVSPTTGDVKITESTPLYICPGGAFPGTDSSNCPTLEKTGVRFDRTILQQQDGLVIRVSDNYVSTDGNVHQVKLHYYNNAYLANGPMWQLAGEQGYGGVGDGTTVDKPATPGSAVAHDFYTGIPYWEAFAGLTWLTQPDRLQFGSYYEPYADYTVGVPAGGASPVTQVFTAARSSEETEQLARTVEDSAGSPVVEITAPANGTAVDHADVTVQGTARDNKGVSTLKVNGVTATIAGDGTWSVPLHLAPGDNAISAVAQDAQGNTGQAQVTLTYVPPVAPKPGEPAKPPVLCSVPAVKRGATQTTAKKAIVKGNCKVGKVTKARSRKVRKGRVISIAPRAGYMLVPGAKVDLRVSSGKPAK
ncbi:MAG: Ig-like protein [Solirubrobacterales bacterium]|nr:Ig-like protein [Solirubrobacterales bacterium]